MTFDYLIHSRAFTRTVKKLVPVREQELIALRLLITNQAWEVCQGGFPASLIYVLIVIARCPFDF